MKSGCTLESIATSTNVTDEPCKIANYHDAGDGQYLVMQSSPDDWIRAFEVVVKSLDHDGFISVVAWGEDRDGRFTYVGSTGRAIQAGQSVTVRLTFTLDVQLYRVMVVKSS